jgi:hypothetical protein
VCLFALAPGGFKEAAQDAVIFEAFVGAGALNDSAHDDHGTQTAFCLIVGGRDVGASEAGQEQCLFLAQETLSKGLGSWMAQRVAADVIELLAQAASPLPRGQHNTAGHVHLPHFGIYQPASEQLPGLVAPASCHVVAADRSARGQQ